MWFKNTNHSLTTRPTLWTQTKTTFTSKLRKLLTEELRTLSTSLTCSPSDRESLYGMTIFLPPACTMPWRQTVTKRSSRSWCDLVKASTAPVPGKCKRCSSMEQRPKILSSLIPARPRVTSSLPSKLESNLWLSTARKKQQKLLKSSQKLSLCWESQSLTPTHHAQWEWNSELPENSGVKSSTPVTNLKLKWEVFPSMSEVEGAASKHTSRP